MREWFGLRWKRMVLNQDGKDERMDQELGTDQDLWDGRIFQEQDGQYGSRTDPKPYYRISRTVIYI
ncbi:hypothetical protein [Sphingobacterium mizutaii]|uniref:hypothetical protein n=1 Tax=Sphingobacterium mizutaii TaxID=1010 RepID=UPI0016265574|nr:hypothetical protein [Sphingobacterium mizutaii]